MNENLSILLTTATVFFSIYMIIKEFTDFLLRRKIIKSGHVDKAGILEPLVETSNDKKYPTLKWGLVALFAGAGIIVIELMSNAGGLMWMKEEKSILPLGIELVFIAAGFLTYFFIVNYKKS
ncbi:MAG: hypothetical protein AB9842_03160 [Bacteroidales bacterium]